MIGRAFFITACLAPLCAAGTTLAQAPNAASGAKDCVICHLQWAEAFNRASATLLIDRPIAPIVADQAACLGCHDGSVGDARRRVWLEHGHQTGIAPPAAMNVPDVLPLEDGKIACRTCHSAHGGPSEAIADVVFTRVPNDASQLCQMCHTEHTKGPELGTHPIGGMPWPVPDALVAAGAKVGPDRFRLVCQTCHTPHGAPEESLLVMGTNSSQLCLTCHSQLRPGMWRPDVEREHPQNPPLETAEQRQAIVDMGTRMGPDDTLICLSCHKLHHGLAGRRMLADTLEESSLCIRCHSERNAMFGTAHDLRVSAPDERNRNGMTAEASGPCGACHSFHSLGRRPAPTALDPTGLCTTCHQQGECAAEAPALPFSHPSEVDVTRLPDALELELYHGVPGDNRSRIACLTCHDPHDTQHDPFLRHDPDALCAKCHSAEAATLAGGHDFTSQPNVQNARGRTANEAGKCGFCHGMHNANGAALWIATSASPAGPDDTCIECHREDGLAAAKPESLFRHPTGPPTTEAACAMDPNLPLYDAEGHRAVDGFVACASCHDPHMNPSLSPALLRVGPKPADLCVTCHADQAVLSGGEHDIFATAGAWPEDAQRGNDLCLACHQVHSNDPQRELWTVAPMADYTSGDGACLSCHGHVEWADPHGKPAPGATMHPRVSTRDDHGLPLVPTSPGEVPSIIGCKTCHNPHGSPTGPAHLIRAGQHLDPTSMCLRCHENVVPIGFTMHSTEALTGHPSTAPAGDARFCGPCHSVHAEDLGDAAVLRTVLPAAKTSERVAQCISCHGPGGGATAVETFEHPFVQMINTEPPGSEGFMPLVDVNGAIAAEGQLACMTCHLPHGRPPGRGFQPDDADEMTPMTLRSMMPMIRSYVAPNLCSSCHGFDGLRRFLYFHDADLRAPEPTTQRLGPTRPTDQR